MVKATRFKNVFYSDMLKHMVSNEEETFLGDLLQNDLEQTNGIMQYNEPKRPTQETHALTKALEHLIKNEHIDLTPAWPARSLAQK